MNTLGIIAALLAFLTGGFIGTQLPATDEQEPVSSSEEVVAAEDYVVLRPAIDTMPAEALSPEEQADLIFMREEEKLAHDVYRTLYDRWGVQIFSNIAQSELTHTETIRNLLTKYNLADPVTTTGIGVFTNPDLAQLYTDLTQTGSQSLVDALRVGALIEDLDIKDLAEALARTDNADITLVYENLTRGSENHIRAFTRQLNGQGVTYVPTYISASEYESIISTGTERGGGGSGQGGGNGGGQGKGRN